MTYQSLASHVEIYKRTRAQIASEFALDEDDEAVTDTTEGETDLIEYLAGLLREARHAAAMANGIAIQMKETAARKARLEAKHDRFRAIVLHAMADANIPKLEVCDFTASRTKLLPSLVIPDPDSVPDAYCRIVREPSKTKIREALKNGAVLEWAFLGNGSETLTVRGT